jgi:tRNA(adenine34) deaminase
MVDGGASLTGWPSFFAVANVDYQASMTDHQSFMDVALREARQAGDAGEVPVGAVVVHRGHIIGRGRNACERLQDATAHAEMLAISAAGATQGTWRLEDCTLYVTLEPCPMCMGAALNARILQVVYGAREPKCGACGSVVDLSAPPGYNHRIEVIGGIQAEESAHMLKAFFRRLRETRN